MYAHHFQEKNISKWPLTSFAKVHVGPIKSLVSALQSFPGKNGGNQFGATTSNSVINKHLNNQVKHNK